jgi:hypothetical protein
LPHQLPALARPPWRKTCFNLLPAVIPNLLLDVAGSFRISFGLDRRCKHRDPFFDVGADEGGEFLRRAAEGVGPLPLQGVANLLSYSTHRSPRATTSPRSTAASQPAQAGRSGFRRQKPAPASVGTSGMIDARVAVRSLTLARRSVAPTLKPPIAAPMRAFHALVTRSIRDFRNRRNKPLLLMFPS